MRYLFLFAIVLALVFSCSTENSDSAKTNNKEAERADTADTQYIDSTDYEPKNMVQPENLDTTNFENLLALFDLVELPYYATPHEEREKPLIPSVVRQLPQWAFNAWLSDTTKLKQGQRLIQWMSEVIDKVEDDWWYDIIPLFRIQTNEKHILFIDTFEAESATNGGVGELWAITLQNEEMINAVLVGKNGCYRYKNMQGEEYDNKPSDEEYWRAYQNCRSSVLTVTNATHVETTITGITLLEAHDYKPIDTSYSTTTIDTVFSIEVELF